MTVDVKVPVLAESVPDATLLEWRKQPGDAVDRDEILIELETDKVVLEVPAPEAGVLTEILKHTGDTVLSQEVLARIDPGTGASTAPPGLASVPAAAPAATTAPSAAAAGRERLSPAVRRLVEEHSLDATTISGTGRDGRITKSDVLAHLEVAARPADADSAPAAVPAESASAPEPVPIRTEPAPSTPAPARIEPTTAASAPGSRDERREPMSRLRRRIAERLVEAQHTAAILTTFNEIDMQPVMALRGRHKEGFERRHGVRLGFMSFFAKAAVQALRRFPAVNARIDGTDIVHHDYCDIGVAVGSPRGLVVPILRNVEAMSFAEIESRIAEFGAKARDGSLSIDDMSGGTFTISNGGVFGSLLSTPILNPPQSGILGMHKTEERPVVVDGEVVVRPMMYVALSYDHRIIDGREAVQFLVCVKEAIEDPARLLLDV
ncbi:MAG: 2-oxoglutarate dehydrogenase complex dihydrolipoyllysine-residue succinyltransferase [Gammaproteobacteria bacterium]|nr:2-oxoglutarate dehydrogenase complex dihydrolipoyllysine-residue succinyltransferase [Gammaproteobacteria bacterium]